jgi:hypothetical protein
MKRPFAASFAWYPLARSYVSRFSNATSVTRGMPRTFTKWQLPQLWYSRRAIVSGMDRQSRANHCRLETVGDFRRASWAVARSSTEAARCAQARPKGPIGTPPSPRALTKIQLKQR